MIGSCSNILIQDNYSWYADLNYGLMSEVLIFLELDYYIFITVLCSRQLFGDIPLNHFKQLILVYRLGNVVGPLLLPKTFYTLADIQLMEPLIQNVHRMRPQQGTPCAEKKTVTKTKKGKRLDSGWLQESIGFCRK